MSILNRLALFFDVLGVLGSILRVLISDHISIGVDSLHLDNLFALPSFLLLFEDLLLGLFLGVDCGGGVGLGSSMGHFNIFIVLRGCGGLISSVCVFHCVFDFKSIWCDLRKRKCFLLINY